MKDEITELRELCADIRKFIQEERLSEAKEKIALGMAQHPDAGIPHNLMGIVKEIENDRVGAMKHFRAAYALDPKNTSIRKNIDSLCAFRPTYKHFCSGYTWKNYNNWYAFTCHVASLSYRVFNWRWNW